MGWLRTLAPPADFGGDYTGKGAEIEEKRITISEIDVVRPQITVILNTLVPGNERGRYLSDNGRTCLRIVLHHCRNGWQREKESTAFAKLALYPNATLVSFDDLFH